MPGGLAQAGGPVLDHHGYPELEQLSGSGEHVALVPLHVDPGERDPVEVDPPGADQAVERAGPHLDGLAWRFGRRIGRRPDPVVARVRRRALEGRGPVLVAERELEGIDSLAEPVRRQVDTQVAEVDRVGLEP